MLDREFQRKRRIRGAIYSKTTAVILAIIAVLLIKPTWDMYRKKAESRQDLERIAQELHTLKERQVMLSKDIDRLATQEGTEEEIRKRFAVAKEGETVVLIVDPERNKGATQPPEKKLVARAWDSFVAFFIK